MMVKRIFIIVMLFIAIAMSLFPAQNDENQETIVFQLSADDSMVIAQQLASVQNNIKIMLDNGIECSDLIRSLKEAESVFENLKTSVEIKDPGASKDLLLLKISAVDSKARERVNMHKRMNLLYQIMVISGMCVIIMMILYSIYMYSKRK